LKSLNLSSNELTGFAGNVPRPFRRIGHLNLLENLFSGHFTSMRVFARAQVHFYFELPLVWIFF
jgi:hypothetical protein